MKIGLISLISLFYLIALPAQAIQIMIDPGHGGSDRGATRGEAVESHIALEIANKLTAKLKETKGIQVMQTRDTDRALPLKDRVQYSETEKPDFFISLHVNSSEDQRARGVEFYFAPSETNLSEISGGTNKENSLAEQIIKDRQHTKKIYTSKDLAKFLAEKWQDGSTSTAAKRRRILQAPFYVISKNEVPSLLVELGFLTNPQESLDLRNSEHQDKITKEIYQGILDFIASKKKL